MTQPPRSPAPPIWEPSPELSAAIDKLAKGGANGEWGEDNLGSYIEQLCREAVAVSRRAAASGGERAGPGWSGTNDRVDPDDEIVVTGANFHMERMSDGVIWFSVNDEAFTLTASKGKIAWMPMDSEEWPEFIAALRASGERDGEVTDWRKQEPEVYAVWVEHCPGYPQGYHVFASSTLPEGWACVHCGMHRKNLPDSTAEAMSRKLRQAWCVIVRLLRGRRCVRCGDFAHWFPARLGWDSVCYGCLLVGIANREPGPHVPSSLRFR